METAVKNKVGYKKTKLGWIPEDWEEVKLEKIISKFVVPMRDKPRELSGEIPWCRIEDFEGKYLFGSKSRQGVSEQVVKDMNLKVYPEGTLLVSCSANLGKCAIVGNPLVTNQTFIGLVPIVKNVDTELLYYIMISSAGRLNRLSTGTTISYLSREEFEKFNITLPKSLPEQQKIATILSTWDNAIDKLTQLITAKEQRKKGLMQLLLTGKKRFAGFTEEWKEVKLGEIAILITKGTTPSSVGFNFETAGINFIKAENLNEVGEILIDQTPKISGECDQVLRRSRLEEGDVLFSIAGTLGRTAIVKSAHLPANTNQALSIIRMKNQNTEYIQYQLNSARVDRFIQQMVAVGAQPNINLQQVGNIKIPFPSSAEQQKIASTLSAADKEIELLKQGINNLQQQKKGLMQKLLTGEVRVKI